MIYYGPVWRYKQVWYVFSEGYVLLYISIYFVSKNDLDKLDIHILDWLCQASTKT